jgi:hypothetical protein
MKPKGALKNFDVYSSTPMTCKDFWGLNRETS